MAKVTSASLDAKGQSLAIVVARFNSYITSKLLEGAVDAFVRHGGSEEALHTVYVPGAFEIPLAAKTLAQSGQYSGIVCLGAVIRGDTPHFDYVCAQSASGINQVALETGIPVINGILTTDNVEQAIDRAGVKAGNKGWDVTLAAIEMVNVLKQLR